MAFQRRSLAFFCSAICAGLLFAARAGAAQTLPPRYVGSEACLACHEDVAEKIAQSGHHQVAAHADAPERRGCEACHGPGSNHVNSGGDKSLLFSFQGASAAEIRARCGACHKSQSDSAHAHRTLTCLNCHAAHRYRQKKFLLVEAPPLLCTNCHDRR